MSKTVTIPSGDNPFIAKINDKYYSYPAGTTVEVPDEVAALIGSIEGNDPPATIPAAPVMPRGGAVNDVLTRTATGAEWKAPATPASELPAVSGTDNGKVLKVVEGAWAAASAPSGVMVVHGNDDTGVLDKTWQEINDAVASGMVVTVAWGVDSQLTLVSYCGENEGEYSVELWSPRSYETVYYAVTDSSDGYPYVD